MYEIGDKFTINGCYKRRTFMQWIKREPKILQVFVVTETSGSFQRYEEANDTDKR